MPFRVTYACTSCQVTAAMYDDARRHANITGHILKVVGELSPDNIVAPNSSLPQDEKDAIRTRAAAVARTREAEILRRARDMGVVSGKDAAPDPIFEHLSRAVKK